MWLSETLPNLKAKASDGNAVFSPRQGLERFRQFTMREHKIYISPLSNDEDVTKLEWNSEDEEFWRRLIKIGNECTISAEE